MWITKKLKKHRVFEGDPQKSCIFSRKMQKKMWITSGKNVDRNVLFKKDCDPQKSCIFSRKINFSDFFDFGRNVDQKMQTQKNAAKLCICNIFQKCRSRIVIGKMQVLIHMKKHNKTLEFGAAIYFLTMMILFGYVVAK